MTIGRNETHPEAVLFEPNGREPELPGYDKSDAPMLGGARRQWPSIAAHLLSEQHRAQRAWNMDRVWVMRRLRYRLQQRLGHEREVSLFTGQPVKGITDDDAFAEIIAEKMEVQEELDQAVTWRRYTRVEELRNVLAILDEIIAFWEPRILPERLDIEA